MNRTRAYPFLAFIVLILLTGLACQGLTALPAATEAVTQIDTEAIVADAVREAVATVQADLPQQTTSDTAVAPAPATQLPVVLDGDLQSALINVYARVNPSVVHIFVFDDLEGSALPLGSGSGFVYDEEGHVVTNNHVVADGERFEVVFADGQRSAATLVGTDVDSDLGVLRVEQLPDGVTPVGLANSDELKVGQFVIAIGNPFGEQGSMSIGIISGLGRTLESQRIAEGGGRYSLPQVIQTDAAINPGNSGGPLLNLQGEVVGVNSAILTRTGTNSGVGFSIPVNAVRQIVPVLITDGSYTYPYIGIRMLSLNLELQEQLGVDRIDGAYVTDVSPGSPAEAAGLIGSNGPGGDLIVSINDTPVRSSDDLISYLVFRTVVGDTVELTVVRDGEEIKLPLTLGERP